MRNDPIFIVGCPRSGTTLLQWILKSHPRISFPSGESGFFIRFYRNIGEYGDLSRVEDVERLLTDIWATKPDYFERMFLGIKFDPLKYAKQFHRQGCDSITKIIDSLYLENAKAENKIRWGDKTPFYVLHLDKILDIFPTAQVIHVIRDGRDVALSLFGRKEDFGIYNVYCAAKYWEQYVTAGQEFGKKFSNSTYMELRYEDIITDTAGTLKKVCSFLEEEFSVSLLNYQRATIKGKTPMLAEPIQKSNFNKWKKEFSLGQQKVFEKVAGNLLDKCGYEIRYRTGSFTLPEKVWYRGQNRLYNLISRHKI